MLKKMKRIMLCCFIAVLFGCMGLIRDRKALQDGLIRFHVIANSDRETDQAMKYRVRDAVLERIQEDLAKIGDIQEAKAYLEKNLPIIETVVKQTLTELGYTGGFGVKLCKEVFDTRYYDTFSLPAGVYESLQIIIGKGEGKNWWCVSFPALCLPTTCSAFQETAAGSGFSEPLVQTLSGNPEYKIRFFLLDQLGKLENIFFRE